MLDDLRAALWAQFCCIWWLVTIICLIPIIVALLWMRKHDGCGIPLYFWVIGYFSLVILFVTALLFVPCCLSANNLRCFQIYLLVVPVVYVWLQAIWCIYGHTIYFSDDNDCGEKSATRGWMIFMIILLFIGLFSILGALFITCIICCFWSQITASWEQQAEQSSEQRESLVGKLQAVFYNPE